MEFYNDIEPIHELPSDELEDLIKRPFDSLMFLWTNEPGPGESFRDIQRDADFSLLTVIHSIKKSLLHFYPDREEELSEVTNANEASWHLYAVEKFGPNSYPYNEGIVALSKIYTQTGQYYKCEAENIDAAIKTFHDMEKAILKYAGSARYYGHQEEKPLIDEGKKRKNQLSAPRDKRNKTIKKACEKLFMEKGANTANELFSRFPLRDKPLVIDGCTIYRENTEEGEEKIFNIAPDGKVSPVGKQAFAKNYWKRVKAENSMYDNS